MSRVDIKQAVRADSSPVWEQRIDGLGNIHYVRPGREPLMTDADFVAALRASAMHPDDDPEGITSAPDPVLEALLSDPA